MQGYNATTVNYDCKMFNTVTPWYQIVVGKELKFKKVFIFIFLKEFHIFPHSCLPTSGITSYNIDAQVMIWRNKLVRLTWPSTFSGETSIIKTLHIRNVQTP
jgi:hypothetical protein